MCPSVLFLRLAYLLMICNGNDAYCQQQGEVCLFHSECCELGIDFWSPKVGEFSTCVKLITVTFKPAIQSQCMKAGTNKTNLRNNWTISKHTDDISEFSWQHWFEKQCYSRKNCMFFMNLAKYCIFKSFRRKSGISSWLKTFCGQSAYGLHLLKRIN